MGADLYIQSLYHYDAEKHEFVGNEEEGYFRDSYNSTSLFWALGLSWWGDIPPLVDDEGNLPPEKIRDLRALIVARGVPAPDAATLIENGALLDDEHPLDGWHDYFRKKKERFLAFLDRALEKNEAIYCSI